MTVSEFSGSGVLGALSVVAPRFSDDEVVAVVSVLVAEFPEEVVVGGLPVLLLVGRVVGVFAWLWAARACLCPTEEGPVSSPVRSFPGRWVGFLCPSSHRTP